MRITANPFACARVPFANERQLQRFVVEMAPDLFGVQVVASTLPGGRPLHRIDILAVDASDRVYIIECKWDAIDEATVKQLSGYRDALLSDWRSLEARVAEHRGDPLRSLSQSVLLLAIGFRCDGAQAERAESIEKVIYKYQPNAFGRFVEAQSEGIIRFAVAEDQDYRSDSHPEVLKTRSARARTNTLPTALQQMFWSIDARLRRLDGVRPKYRGKQNARDLALYRRDRKVFCIASIEANSILWRPGSMKHAWSIEMGVDCNAEKAFEILRRAHETA